MYVCMYVCMYVINRIPCLFLTDLWNRIQKYSADVTSPDTKHGVIQLHWWVQTEISTGTDGHRQGDIFIYPNSPENWSTCKGVAW